MYCAAVSLSRSRRTGATAMRMTMLTIFRSQCSSFFNLLVVHVDIERQIKPASHSIKAVSMGCIRQPPVHPCRRGISLLCRKHVRGGSMLVGQFWKMGR